MERECEEGEIEKKLRRSFVSGNYNNRASPSTPPPTWRLGLPPPSSSPSRPADFSVKKEFLANSEVSVRKLCAELWEAEQFRPPIELRRCRRRDSDAESPCGSPLHDHQPTSRSSLRRQIQTTNDHRNVDISQPISPASCSSSSLEVVVRKPAFSQTGSTLVKSASYGLGSSTKLLKVLNRIWSLEEQNAANVSLVKALKMELDECRAEIKQVQHRDKRIWKKDEEEEELKNVFRSIKKELDDEREVRKKSESMHRKLTRELCEAKHCLKKALKDLEKERKERIAVENLCDEFAKAVKGYEDKVRRFGNKSPVSDKVIVQVAEVWTDQRLQVKQEEDASMHQSKCLKELEERLEKRTRRDNKLRITKSKKGSDRVFDVSMSSEGDKIHPETSPRNVNVKKREENNRSLKEKLMEARVESRRLRPLKPESSPIHHPV